MKIQALILALFTLVPLLHAQEPHDQEKEKIPGPHKGKVVEGSDYHMEFLIMPDRKAAFYFYDDAMKPVAPGSYAVDLTTGTRAEMKNLPVVADANRLISEGTLPEGSENFAIIQVKPESADSSKTFRIRLNESSCGSCDFLEYACICEGH